ncbi:hypothetical protein FPV67DRAFT_1188955 [Lyophyllum atratum]|nr:hypothetical protein FPV67DRAFT_1188955 [Lyophyllum atratum]
MNPTDAFLLHMVGYHYLQNTTRLVTTTFLYGAAVLLFAFSTSILLKRGLKSRPTIMMFTATLTSFLLLTANWICIVSIVVSEIRLTLIKLDENTFNGTTMAQVDTDMYPFRVAEVWAQQLLLILSDSVVVWRAWALFQDNIWVQMGLSLLLLGASGANFAFIALISTDIWVLIVSSIYKASPVTLVFNSFMALSFATNAIATMLIVYKLWAHQKSRNILELHNTQSSVQKILIIIVESGLVFLALQLANLISNFAPFERYSPADFFQTAIFVIYTAFAGVYPSMVVYLVAQQRSMVETFGLGTSTRKHSVARTERVRDRPATLGHLSFVRASRDESTLSQDSRDTPIGCGRDSDETEKDSTGRSAV